MSVPSSSFHSLPLKLPNKGIDFPFPPLKLPNKGMKEYSKMILFIHFHSTPFPPPKRGLSITCVGVCLKWTMFVPKKRDNTWLQLHTIYLNLDVNFDKSIME